MQSTSELRAAFRTQRACAKRRGIAWQLSFEKWLAIWTASGHLEQRGRRKGEYVMARSGDVGPYAEGNVFICLHSENISTAYQFKPCGGALLVGRGRGWTKTKAKSKPFQVMFRGRRVGCFATQQEAESAYQEAVQKFSRGEPRNATQSFCGGLRA